VQPANSEVLKVLGRGELPTEAQIARTAFDIGIPEKDYRWLSAELWLAVVNQTNPGTVGAEKVDLRAIGEQIKRSKRSLSNYFIIGRSIHFWWKGMLGDYLTSDDRLYAAFVYHIFVNGCRIFASRQELTDAIIGERWDGWEEWQEGIRPAEQ
jgi:hypothetical protein